MIAPCLSPRARARKTIDCNLHLGHRSQRPPDAAAAPPDEQVLESLPEGRGEERVEDRVDAGVAVGQHVAPYLLSIWIFRQVFSLIFLYSDI